jgi:hypothetical protein
MTHLLQLKCRSNPSIVMHTIWVCSWYSTHICSFNLHMVSAQLFNSTANQPLFINVVLMCASVRQRQTWIVLMISIFRWHQKLNIHRWKARGLNLGYRWTKVSSISRIAESKSLLIYSVYQKVAIFLSFFFIILLKPVCFHLS